jgi:hypothetical protein
MTAGFSMEPSLKSQSLYILRIKTGTFRLWSQNSRLQLLQQHIIVIELNEENEVHEVKLLL